MTSDVEIRITIRDGTATVAGAGMAAQSGLPAPEADMGGGESTVSSLLAPSPTDGAVGGALAGDSAGPPSPTDVGAFAGVAASGELPSPLPLDEVAQLTGSGGSDAGSAAGASDLPAPDDDQG